MSKLRQVMHVDMDAFFASVEQQTFPFLRGKPIGVCGDPDGRTVIAAASYEAKRRGIKTAMTIPEARRLCPDITLVPGNPARYIDTSVRILAIYAQYTDLVEVFSIDEAFLDVSDSAHLHGGTEAVARAIKIEIRERFGITCSVGIAPNKLLAKLVGEMNKPDGLTVLEPGRVQELLAKTPVREMCGIGPKTTTSLNRLGVTTCADLGRYSESDLVRLFGINGNKLHRMGLGEDESPVMPYYHESETKSMGHSFTLNKDTRDRTIIRRHLLQLSEQVGRRLRRDGYSGRTVALIIRYADFTTHVRRRSSRNYVDDGHRIYAIGMKLFEELYQPYRYVRLLGISVSNLVRHIKQEDLFVEQRRGSLFDATDVINNRFGEFSVARARLNRRKPGPGVISPAWRPNRF